MSVVPTLELLTSKHMTKLRIRIAERAFQLRFRSEFQFGYGMPRSTVDPCPPRGIKLGYEFA